MASMRCRGLALLLVLYVAADFANPMMPGAVSFDPAESVEGIHAARAPQSSVTVLPAPTPPQLEGPSRDPSPTRWRPTRPVRLPFDLPGPPAHAASPDDSSAPADPH